MYRSQSLEPLFLLLARAPWARGSVCTARLLPFTVAVAASLAVSAFLASFFFFFSLTGASLGSVTMILFPSIVMKLSPILLYFLSDLSILSLFSSNTFPLSSKYSTIPITLTGLTRSVSTGTLSATLASSAEAKVTIVICSAIPWSAPDLYTSTTFSNISLILVSAVLASSSFTLMRIILFPASVSVYSTLLSKFAFFLYIRFL